MAEQNSLSWKELSSRDEMPMNLGDEVMGGWKLVRTLGKGGFGTVFEAVQNNLGEDARAAIKLVRIQNTPEDRDAMLSAGMSEADLVHDLYDRMERSVREISTAVTLRDHPGIVRCDDFELIRYDEDSSWDILIRMELLTPLTAWIREQPVTEQTVLRLGLEISDLLDYCGQQGILHRDIKPANLFVNKIGHFKLGDFGLARMVGSSTSTLSHVGTEPFMAPEVANGGTYNASADVYGLGLVLYWLLNGQRLPFLESGTSFANATAIRLSGTAIPLIPMVSPLLMHAVSTALAYEPIKRWPDGKAFHKALSRCSATERRIERAVAQESYSGFSTERKLASFFAPEPAAAPEPTPTPPAPVPAPEAAKEPEPVSQRSSARVIPVSAGPASARPTPLSSFSFGRCKGGSRITKFVGTEHDVVLPPEDPQGRPVREISANAFRGSAVLHSVTLQKGITEIGKYAFEGCKNLIRVDLREGILEIGDHAFQGCSALTDIRLPESLQKLGTAAFMNCARLREVTIAGAVSRPGEWAFCGCSNLTNVTLKPGIQILSKGLLANCRQLTSLEIPDGVRVIGDSALANTGITELELPTSVTFLGVHAFAGCKQLQRIVIPDSVTQMGIGILKGSRQATVVCSQYSYAFKHLLLNKREIV